MTKLILAVIVVISASLTTMVVPSRSESNGYCGGSV